MPGLPLRARVVGAIALFIAAPSLPAYTLYDASYLPGYTWNKWGDPAVPSSATVYWSLMPVGTPAADYCALAGCSGTSTLSLPNFYDWATHTFSSVQLTDPAVFGYIRAAFRAWGLAAGIDFVYVPNDSGVQINDPSAVPPATGQIRIGVFDLGTNGPAAGYAAPPNGFYVGGGFQTGAGDVLLNSNSIFAFQNPAGAEGAHLESFPEGGGLFLNDLQGLILHEIGHALGLDHSAVASAVMCGYPNSCTYNDPVTYVINRQPEPDDVAGIQTLYGPPLDSDGDGVLDAVDNCISVGNNEAGAVPNSGGLLKAQLDADGDGYGNFCDSDINNSGKTTTADYTRLRNVLSRPYDFNADSAAADMNGSGMVTTADYTLLRNRLNLAPGPSGLAP